jgi:hypothetical protein
MSAIRTWFTPYLWGADLVGFMQVGKTYGVLIRTPLPLTYRVGAFDML